MKSDSLDVIIIGGGIMGCATAYHLMNYDNRLKVVVIEMDPTYTRASTTLSMGNVRIQFSLRENIEISQYAFTVLNGFSEEMAVGENTPHVSFRPEGNLFLFALEEQDNVKKAFDLQRSLACSVEWLSPADISARYPLFDVEGLAGGTFGSTGGHFDAHAFLMGYRAKARALGAQFVHDEVVAIERGESHVDGVRLRKGNPMRARYVVNCAGAWATEIARSAGIDLPVQPVKRQVFVLDTKEKLASPLPLTVLPSGLFFRSETGGLILLGKSMVEDPVGIDFSWDDKRFFEKLWPELAAFIPAFDTLKLYRGWAGLYAVNTLDGNAILGEWPEMKGLYFANGFSGHGLQQGPAVGRYIAELILQKKVTMDLSRFGPERIIEQKPISETGLV
jgi:glycine/D-amino acid oxidase-like deaminating enzyme